MELSIPAEIVAHIVSYIVPKKQSVELVVDEPPPLMEYNWLNEFALPIWVENDKNIFANEKATRRKNAQSVRDLKNLRLSCKCFASIIEPSFAYELGSFMRRQYIQIMLGNFHLALQYLKDEFCQINVNILLNQGTNVYIGSFTWPCYFVTYAHILQDNPELVLDSEKMHLLFHEEIESTKLEYSKYLNPNYIFKKLLIHHGRGLGAGDMIAHRAGQRGIIPENWMVRRLIVEPPD